MPGVGITKLGTGYVGSGVDTTAQESLGDFNFSVEALSIGKKIRASIDIPGLTEAPTWAREIRILRKLGEWPNAYNDSEAHLLVSKSYSLTGGITETFDDSVLTPGKIYYYGLFEKRVDGSWIHDRINGRSSAYAYGRWGFADELFKSMPPGFQIADSRNGNQLQKFLSIFGALFDNLKTDAENLLTLFEIDNIDEKLLELLDDKIAWPTWYATGALQRRKETAQAVSIYKLIGRAKAYELLLEEVSDWEAEIAEGWRYVMFSNGLHNSKTPDPSDPNLLPNIGYLSDIAKYTNSNTDWHSVTGLVFKLSQIPGVSGPFTQVMSSRYAELIEFAKANYVNYNLYLIPLDEEDFLMSNVIDEWSHQFDVYNYAESYPSIVETDMGASTSTLFLFMSNSLTSTTNTIDDRTFHGALSYV